MREEIINQAENLKKLNGRINLVDIANSLGIKVFSTKEIQAPSFIAYDPEVNYYEIYINAKEPGTRQRFSIAHEIAHFILHKDKIISFGIVGRQSDASLSVAEEREADSLAAEILMPKNSIIESLAKYGISTNDKIETSTVKSIAHEFEVSIIAMALRLRELGYYVGYIECY